MSCQFAQWKAKIITFSTSELNVGSDGDRLSNGLCGLGAGEKLDCRLWLVKYVGWSGVGDTRAIAACIC